MWQNKSNEQMYKDVLTMLYWASSPRKIKYVRKGIKNERYKILSR